MSWWAYVTRTSGTDAPKSMTAVTGIDGPNFSRWKNGHIPKVEMVVQFARAYGRPVLEAFVAAGFITPEEAKVRPAPAPDYSQLTNDELLELVRQRMGDSDGTATTEGPDGPAPNVTEIRPGRRSGPSRPVKKASRQRKPQANKDS